MYACLAVCLKTGWQQLQQMKICNFGSWIILVLWIEQILCSLQLHFYHLSSVLPLFILHAQPYINVIDYGNNSISEYMHRQVCTYHQFSYLTVFFPLEQLNIPSVICSISSSLTSSFVSEFELPRIRSTEMVTSYSK